MALDADDAGRAIGLRALKRCLSDRDTAMMHDGCGRVCDLAENLPAEWPAVDPLGRSDVDSLPAEIAAPLIAAKQRVLDTSTPETLEIEVLTPKRRIFRLQVSGDSGADGRPAGLFTTISDITELRERELAMYGLLREVSHRSKNLLAIVQAIAAQTANHSGSDTTIFLHKFRGRLQALASTQDLVTDTDWRGTLLQSLVAAQLGRLGHGLLETVRVAGDNPLLRPNAALHVGLALHELASNALLYGALSGQEPGSVSVVASVSALQGARRTLNIDWVETMRDCRDPQGPRFGTLVLERIVPLSVGGSAFYEIGPGRVTYSLTLPSTQFET